MTFTLSICGWGNMFAQNLHKKYGLQNFSPYSTPKFLFRAPVPPYSPGIPIVELLPVSLIHEQSMVVLDTSSQSVTSMNLGQDFTQQLSLPAKNRS